MAQRHLDARCSGRRQRFAVAAGRRFQVVVFYLNKVHVEANASGLYDNQVGQAEMVHGGEDGPPALNKMRLS